MGQFGKATIEGKISRTDVRPVIPATVGLLNA